ncbi:exodeoxyribonuclease V subunit alpha [Plebeiibacterium sediminum]|uniref:RecBCD enzyme subunit RecD n=1 Tax=Plebeiibacterium sediminum TaxID=2992112 RepID=A0AAE3M4Q4_9BACT|nr:exodeoxyribonuclease V subunit alpha [Plebeiobacterium sediminum]MCW3786864.1 exodeoxyribonuclease V subunit alpha [Plebeiobacterium sediminum]
MSQNIDIHKEFARFFNDEKLQQAAYVVSQKLAEGHTCVDVDQYNKQVEETGQERNEFTQTIDKKVLHNSDLVACDDSNIQPFVLYNDKLYLHRYFSYETEIIDSIKRLIGQGTKEKENRIALLNKHKNFIQELFNTHTINKDLSIEENTNWQLVAALIALLSNFSIITGGPGTGKTTTVAKILAVLYTLNPKYKVALAAPTGKAAARMKESLNNARNFLSINEDVKEKFDTIDAATIHRLLGYVKDSPYFRHNSDNPLNFDVLIVDESSMIGSSLMAKLLSAVKPESRIILLGDKDQLASVEAGSILGDICLTQKQCMNHITKENADWINQFTEEEQAKIHSSFVLKEGTGNILQEHIVELKRSHRFKSTEGIGKFSKAVINGVLNEEMITASVPADSEYVQVCNNYKSDELYTLIDHYKAYITEPDIKKALQKLNNVRFLCAVRQGDYGVNQYNQLIEGYLNNKGLIQARNLFYEHQPIMITQNDYNLGLFNGDIGIIRKDEKGKLKAWFEDPEYGIKSIHTGYLNAYDTVFAMTIHKSQGSEFTHVGIVLPNDDNSPLLTRELIYTGITRAKKSAVIFSSTEVLINGTERMVERASGITDRLLQGV